LTRLHLLVVALVLAAVAAVGGVAATASAQTCDPNYGCDNPSTTAASTTSTPTTAPTEGTPSCSLSASSATPGSRVDVLVQSVPDGTSIDILFGGNVVAHGTAGASSAATKGSIGLSFTVPSVPPGSYPVEAVGAGVNLECGAGDGADGFGVLGTGGEQGGDQGRGGGSLARTGIAVGVLVAVAIGLIVVGRVVLAGSRRRQRA
jgi:hypothetical protein